MKNRSYHFIPFIALLHVFFTSELYSLPPERIHRPLPAGMYSGPYGILHQNSREALLKRLRPLLTDITTIQDSEYYSARFKLDRIDYGLHHMKEGFAAGRSAPRGIYPEFEYFLDESSGIQRRMILWDRLKQCEFRFHEFSDRKLFFATPFDDFPSYDFGDFEIRYMLQWQLSNPLRRHIEFVGEDGKVFTSDDSFRIVPISREKSWSFRSTLIPDQCTFKTPLLKLLSH